MTLQEAVNLIMQAPEYYKNATIALYPQGDNYISIPAKLLCEQWSINRDVTEEENPELFALVKKFSEELK